MSQLVQFSLVQLHTQDKLYVLVWPYVAKGLSQTFPSIFYPPTGFLSGLIAWLYTVRSVINPPLESIQFCYRNLQCVSNMFSVLVSLEWLGIFLWKLWGLDSVMSTGLKFSKLFYTDPQWRPVTCTYSTWVCTQTKLPRPTQTRKNSCRNNYTLYQPSPQRLFWIWLPLFFLECVGFGRLGFLHLNVFLQYCNAMQIENNATLVFMHDIHSRKSQVLETWAIITKPQDWVLCGCVPSGTKHEQSKE